MSKTIESKLTARREQRREIMAKHGLNIVRAVMTAEQEIKFVKEMYSNFPEASMPSFRCVAYSYGDKPYKAFEFHFIDEEDEQRYRVNLDDAIKGFRALVFEIIAGKHPGLGLGTNFLTGTEHWDAFAFDAAAQMAAFGEVIYG